MTQLLGLSESLAMSYVPLMKPLLNEEKARLCLYFALRMKRILGRDPSFLQYLLFPNETKLHLFENQTSGNVYVKCHSDERLNPENVNGSVKYVDGGITFWGCMNYSFLDVLYRFHQNLTSYIYRNEIIRDALL